MDVINPNMVAAERRVVAGSCAGFVDAIWFGNQSWCGLFVYSENGCNRRPKTPYAPGVQGFSSFHGSFDMSVPVLAPDGVYSLVDADEAARHCQVSKVTVWGWANRGYRAPTGQRVKLPVSGKDRDGRNLYCLLHVAKAEAATRKRARRTL